MMLLIFSAHEAPKDPWAYSNLNPWLGKAKCCVTCKYDLMCCFIEYLSCYKMEQISLKTKSD